MPSLFAISYFQHIEISFAYDASAAIAKRVSASADPSQLRVLGMWSLPSIEDAEIAAGIAQRRRNGRTAESVVVACEQASALVRGEGLAPVLPSAAATLRGLRRTLGLTQPAFARVAGVSVSTVSRWEGGQRAPDGWLSLARVRAWAALAKIDLDLQDFFGPEPKQ